MPTEYRFDDLDLREEAPSPAKLDDDADVNYSTGQICNTHKGYSCPC